MIKNYLSVFIIFSMLILTGCSQKDEVITNREEVTKPKLDIKQQEALKLNDISYIIITDKNAKQIFDEMKINGKQRVLYAISVDDYEKLAVNLAQIKKYLVIQNETIKSYKDYYEPKN